MTQSNGKRLEWNEINPASEKPKFGRGIIEDEMKSGMGTFVQINGCCPKGNRTWLMIVWKYRENVEFSLFFKHLECPHFFLMVYLMGF